MRTKLGAALLGIMVLNTEIQVNGDSTSTNHPYLLVAKDISYMRSSKTSQGSDKTFWFSLKTYEMKKFLDTANTREQKDQAGKITKNFL